MPTVSDLNNCSLQTGSWQLEAENEPAKRITLTALPPGVYYLQIYADSLVRSLRS